MNLHCGEASLGQPSDSVLSCLPPSNGHHHLSYIWKYNTELCYTAQPKMEGLVSTQQSDHRVQRWLAIIYRHGNAQIRHSSYTEGGLLRWNGVYVNDILYTARWSVQTIHCPFPSKYWAFIMSQRHTIGSPYFHLKGKVYRGEKEPD